MKKIWFFLGLISVANISFSQDSLHTSPLTISGYAEIYYVHDFNKPVNNTRPAFIYSHNRANEVALNLAFVKAAYTQDNVRANISLATGTYMNANLSAEPGVLKNIFEANAGLRLSKKRDWWIDAGIFASHIGFESAVSKDCWNLTRSLLADNSPYYESGVRMSYNSPNAKWYLAAMVLNGWQRIQRVEGNTTPAFGTQVTYKPNNSVTLNSSTFIGNDRPDTARRMRYFHNFYAVLQITPAIAATLGFDAGMEQKDKGSRSMYTWYSPVLILRYGLSSKCFFAARAEYYRDKNGVIIVTGTPDGFATWGFSANLDYAINAHAVWRIEARTLTSEDRIFIKDGNAVNGNTFLSTAIAISF